MKSESEIRAAFEDLHAAIETGQREEPQAELPNLIAFRAFAAWALGIDCNHTDAVAETLDLCRSFLVERIAD